MFGSLALLSVGAICLLLEYTFYQSVDELGFLQESFFLPLGMLLIVMGGFGVLLLLIHHIWRYLRAK